jgi:hypothetical protein
MEPVTLEDILRFWKGMKKVSVGGFHTTPTITFLHDNDDQA